MIIIFMLRARHNTKSARVPRDFHDDGGARALGPMALPVGGAATSATPR